VTNTTGPKKRRGATRILLEKCAQAKTLIQCWSTHIDFTSIVSGQEGRHDGGTIVDMCPAKFQPPYKQNHSREPHRNTVVSGKTVVCLSRLEFHQSHSCANSGFPLPPQSCGAVPWQNAAALCRGAVPRHGAAVRCHRAGPWMEHCCGTAPLPITAVPCCGIVPRSCATAESCRNMLRPHFVGPRTCFPWLRHFPQRGVGTVGPLCPSKQNLPTTLVASFTPRFVPLSGCLFAGLCKAS
jgi:hypothetical protein